MVEETNVAEEGTRQEHISEHSCQLFLEILAAVLPTVFLGFQVVQETLASAHLVFHSLHVGLDVLLLLDERFILQFQLFGLLLQQLSQVQQHQIVAAAVCCPAQQAGGFAEHQSLCHVLLPDRLRYLRLGK